MATIANLTVALNADVAGFTGTMASATRSINQFRKMGQQVFEATRTPLEQYQASLKRLGAFYHGAQIDAETYRRAVARLNDEMHKSQSIKGAGIGGQMAAFGSQLATGVLGISTGVGAAIVAATAVTRAVQMAQDAVEALGTAMVNTGLTAIKLAAEFETAEITLTTLFKSAETAKEVMGQLKAFSAETPFQFPEIKDAAAKLAGFGISAKQVVPTLKMLGDIAAATGSNVNELALTYGKARITGRAYTRDVMEFANRNVPVWQALNKVLGTTNAQTHKLVEEGKVGFAELQRALLSLVSAGGQFEGAMEDRAKGIEGLFSNLADNVTISLADLGEAMVEKLDLKQVATELIDLTGAFRSDAIPVIAEFASAAIDAGRVLNDLQKPLTGIDLSFKGIKETIYGAHAATLQWQMAMAKLAGDSARVAEIQKELIDLAMRAAGMGPKAKSPGLPDIEEGGKQTGLDEEIAQLELQAQMIGKSATEKKLAELTTKGLLEADAEYVSTLLEQIETQEAATAAEEHARKTMESHIAALKLQADTYGASAKNIDLYKSKLAGATAEELKAIEAQHNRIEKMEAQQKESKRLEDEHRRARDEIARIEERNLTPQEKFDRDMAHLRDLRQHGLSDELAGKEAARLQKELDESTKPQKRERNFSNPALIAGTSEFYSAINRSVGGNVKDPAARDRKQALQIQRRQELHERETANAMKRLRVGQI